MIGASKGVTPMIGKNHGRGGGFPGNQKTTLDTPLFRSTEHTPFALFTNSPYWNDNEAAPANGGSGM